MIKSIILSTIGVFSLFTCVMMFVYFGKIVNSKEKNTGVVKALYKRFRLYMILNLVSYNVSMFINETTVEEKIMLLCATIMFYVLLPNALRIFSKRSDFFA